MSCVPGLASCISAIFPEENVSGGSIPKVNEQKGRIDLNPAHTAWSQAQQRIRRYADS